MGFELTWFTPDGVQSEYHGTFYTACVSARDYWPGRVIEKRGGTWVITAFRGCERVYARIYVE